MYLCRSFLLLVGCLFCFATHAPAAPSSDISSPEESRHQDHAAGGEGQLDARRNPYSSTYDDENTSISRNTRRGDTHELKCNDIGKNIYTFRGHIHVRIMEFCHVFPTSRTVDKDTDTITKTFNSGTKEQAVFTLDFHGDYKPHEQDCRDAFISIMDDCSLPDDKNPHNVKAGGTLQLEHFKYGIEPKVERAPAIDALGSGCKCDLYFGKADNACKIWGHGWTTAGNGAAIKKELKTCMYEDTFRFVHRMPKDGIEWEGHFDTPRGKKDCVRDAMQRAGGTAGSNVCSGSGY
ncbi:hypothetical protein IMZ48_06835 [Candidatus Bathyarchaeota archaeon]|nr:hypothetical protein [Candidatus Bathyarchaeota archaeon]